MNIFLMKNVNLQLSFDAGLAAIFMHDYENNHFINHNACLKCVTWPWRIFVPETIFQSLIFSDSTSSMQWFTRVSIRAAEPVNLHDGH